jgi:hypothetical protein
MLERLSGKEPRKNKGVGGDSIRGRNQLLPELHRKRSIAVIAKPLKSRKFFPDSL